MKAKSILNSLVRCYQKNRLGAINTGSNVSLLASLIGDRKNIYLGKDITICKYATLEVDPSDNDKSKIIIGDHTLVSSFAMLRTYGGTIKIGHSSFVNSFTVLYGHGGLTIGNGCLIGPQVSIVPANYGFQNPYVPFRLQPTSLKGIIIEDDVWIGAGVTILDGCKICKGTIVGAGSVVTKSVEAYSIVAGVPAKLIAKRE